MKTEIAVRPALLLADDNPALLATLVELLDSQRENRMDENGEANENGDEAYNVTPVEFLQKPHKIAGRCPWSGRLVLRLSPAQFLQRNYYPHRQDCPSKRD